MWVRSSADGESRIASAIAEQYAMLYVSVSQQEVLWDKIKYCKSDEGALSLPETDLSDHRLFFFFSLNSDPVRSLYPSLNRPTPPAISLFNSIHKKNKFIQEKPIQSNNNGFYGDIARKKKSKIEALIGSELSSAGLKKWTLNKTENLARVCLLLSSKHFDSNIYMNY